MTVAHPAALLETEVAPVRFTPDDDFHDHADTWDLPDGAAALLARAGSWSARNSRNGFVPSSMLARFSSDPVPAVRELVRRRIWRRVAGGCEFADWERWGELAEEIERRRADAAERQRRHRAKKDGEREVKPQVRPRPVTRYSHATSRDSHISRSDLDFDFDQSPQVDQVSQSSRRNTRTRDPKPGTPEFRLLIAAEFAGRTGAEIDDATADVIAADVLGKAVGRVPHPLGYVLKAVRDEADPRARWLPEQPQREPRIGLAGRSEWCGDRCCNRATRRREDPVTGADAGPCPKCSPVEAQREAS